MQPYLSKVALTYLIVGLKNKREKMSEDDISHTIGIVVEFLVQVENYEFLFTGVVDTLTALGFQ